MAFASIRRVLGRIAIVDLSFGDQYGSGTRTDVCDLRGGGCYPVAYRMVVMSSATFGRRRPRCSSRRPAARSWR